MSAKHSKSPASALALAPSSASGPTVEEALQYADGLPADCWADRCIIELAAEVGRLRALEKHWTQEAAAFHRMGKRMIREGNVAGHEYMQTAAAFRACAAQLKKARLPNTKVSHGA